MLLGISVVGWIVRGLIGLVAAVVIYAVFAGMLSKFKIAPDAEPNPDAVVPVNARFRCTVCGAEVTMTAAQEGEELEAPRHCREPMVLVGPQG